MVLFSSSVGKRIRPYFPKFFGVNALISRVFNTHHWLVNLNKGFIKFLMFIYILWRGNCGFSCNYELWCFFLVWFVHHPKMLFEQHMLSSGGCLICVTSGFQFCLTYCNLKRPVLFCVTIEFSICMTMRDPWRPVWFATQIFCCFGAQTWRNI